MTIDQVIQFLYEGLDDVDHQAKVFVDRLLLRMMGSPALMTFLKDVRLARDGDDYVVELLFNKVPEDQLNSIRQIISEQSDIFEFSAEGHPYYGFKIRISPRALTPTADVKTAVKGSTAGANLTGR